MASALQEASPTPEAASPTSATAPQDVGATVPTTPVIASPGSNHGSQGAGEASTPSLRGSSESLETSSVPPSPSAPPSDGHEGHGGTRQASPAGSLLVL